MPCPRIFERLTARIDLHTQQSVLVTTEADGVVSTHPCACCYVLRLLGYGLVAGAVLGVILSLTLSMAIALFSGAL